MKKTLTEWIQVDAGPPGEPGMEPTGPHDDLKFDNAMTGWSGLPYAELSHLLVHLRYLAMLHQTHHWVARGDCFYGDHELFQKLYERTLEDVDDVAEKAVGLGSEQNVDLSMQLGQLVQLAKSVGSPQTVPQSSELAKASLVAERSLLTLVAAVYCNLEQNGMLTPGVDNMLQQVADRHEKHAYLLGRKCAATTLGL